MGVRDEVRGWEALYLGRPVLDTNAIRPRWKSETPHYAIAVEVDRFYDAVRVRLLAPEDIQPAIRDWDPEREK